MDLKGFIKVTFICFTAFIELVMTAKTDNKFEMSKVVSTHYGEELDTSETRSRLECMTRCAKMDACRSSTFNGTSKKCRTNRWTADSSCFCDTGSGCDDPNAVTYGEKVFKTLIGRPCRNDIDCSDAMLECLAGGCQCMPGTIFDAGNTVCVVDGPNTACLSDADCLDPNSECSTNVCACKPGFSYDGTFCVYDCETFGSDFDVLTGKKIAGHNIKTYLLASAEHCKNLCINEKAYLCKSFDYYPLLKFCNLQRYSARDLPNIVSSSIGGDLYTRTCDEDD